jgi:hypothetical protein
MIESSVKVTNVGLVTLEWMDERPGGDCPLSLNHLPLIALEIMAKAMVMEPWALRKQWNMFGDSATGTSLWLEALQRGYKRVETCRLLTWTPDGMKTISYEGRDVSAWKHGYRLGPELLVRLFLMVSQPTASEQVVAAAVQTDTYQQMRQVGRPLMYEQSWVGQWINWLSFGYLCQPPRTFTTYAGYEFKSLVRHRWQSL